MNFIILNISSKYNLRYAIVMLLAIVLACNPTKKIPENQYLLNKNRVKINCDKKLKKLINTEELNYYIKQKPNKKIFGLFRFHLGLYNLANESKDKGINGWLKRIGEEPSIYDSSITKRSDKQLEIYINNKGFYGSTVRDSVLFKKRKSSVYYIINVEKPYKIKSINFIAEDQHINSDISSNMDGSLVKPEQILDIDVLQKERDRITDILRNDGYYNFTKEYIHYEIDSALNDFQANVTMIVKNPTVKISKDSTLEVSHKRFKIRNIYVNTDYNIKDEKKNIDEDTLNLNEYYFIYKHTLEYKPLILLQNIFIKGNDYFCSRDVVKTNDRFVSIREFRFINIDFVTVKEETSANYLDCIIQLTPSSAQSFSVESEGTHSSGNLGISGNLTYTNKNSFRGAEIFEIRFRGGIEIQNSSAESSDGKSIFNTVELGPEMSLRIPKFVIPINAKKFSKNNAPETTISATYNYQKRPSYVRDISMVSFGYKWKETVFKTHIFNPLELNFIKVGLSPEFKLEAIKDAYLRNSYSDHLTANTRWTFIFNNQDIKKFRDFTYLRTNLEFSGNILRMIDKLLNSSIDSLGRYKILNIAYSQYTKADVDYRYYKVFNKSNTVVFRVLTGVGYPYKNSLALPFEKSYFGGGANDIRAWRARSLGPGGFNDTDGNDFDITGDIKFEANIEYRFGLYGFLKGAFFVDMGNIWLINKDANKPNGNFEFDRFTNELAVGSGIGARLDFSFFVIRFDAAVPVRDPSHLENERWLFKSITSKDIILNLGIGYPF